jgi:hypothetical protein
MEIDGNYSAEDEKRSRAFLAEDEISAALRQRYWFSNPRMLECVPANLFGYHQSALDRTGLAFIPSDADVRSDGDHYFEVRYTFEGSELVSWEYADQGADLLVLPHPVLARFESGLTEISESPPLRRIYTAVHYCSFIHQRGLSEVPQDGQEVEAIQFYDPVVGKVTFVSLMISREKDGPYRVRREGVDGFWLPSEEELESLEGAVALRPPGYSGVGLRESIIRERQCWDRLLSDPSGMRVLLKSEDKLEAMMAALSEALWSMRSSPDSPEEDHVDVDLEALKIEEAGPSS